MSIFDIGCDLKVQGASVIHTARLLSALVNIATTRMPSIVSDFDDKDNTPATTTVASSSSSSSLNDNIDNTSNVNNNNAKMTVLSVSDDDFIARNFDIDDDLFARK